MTPGRKRNQPKLLCAIRLAVIIFGLIQAADAHAARSNCTLDRLKTFFTRSQVTSEFGPALEELSRAEVAQQEVQFGKLTEQEKVAALADQKDELTDFVVAEQAQGRTPSEIKRDLDSAAIDLKQSVHISAETPEELATQLAPYEKSAVEALKKVQLTGEEAQSDVRSWFTAIQAEQGSGRKLSVMEHTTLVHILRSGFLDNLPENPGTQKIKSEMMQSLEKSYQELAGKALSAEKILETPLPKSVLKTASYREKQFQLAAFRSPRGAVSSKGTPLTGASTPKQLAIASMLLGIGFSHGGGMPAGEALAGAVTGYAVASAGMEWFTHRFILHMRPEGVRFMKKMNAVGDFVLRNFRFHTGNHHGMFPEKKYTTTINEEWNSGVPIGDGKLRKIQARDRAAEKVGDDPKYLHENQYGMSMNQREITSTSLMGMGLGAIASHIFGFGAEGTAAAIAIAPASSFMTPTFHSFLHMIEKVRLEDASPVQRALMQTQYWRDISRRHYMHHVDTKSNYSLFLPGPDYWFRHIREPDIGDLLRMEEKGVLY